MIFENFITIDSGTVPPIVVTSNQMCAGLNVEFLGGYRAADFAIASHTHPASAITSGYLALARLGEGTPAARRALLVNGSVTNGAWSPLVLTDLSDSTAFGRSLAQAADAAAGRSLLAASALGHTHDAAEVVTGTFAVARLGSGSGSTSHVLVGNANAAFSGQWKQLAYSDVTNAVGNFGSTPGRIPYWSGPGQLSDSPFLCVGSPVSSVTTNADFGTNGSVTCTDLVVNYAAASQFKANIYTKTKSILQGSASVTVTPNDGAQTLTLTSTGGSSPPTSPANAVYVWVVNGTATGGAWYQLTGDNVYVA